VRRCARFDVEVAGLEAGELLVIELGACRYFPLAVAALGQRNDRWPGFTHRAEVNMRRGTVDAGGGDAAAHRFIVTDVDHPASARGRRHRRGFFGAAQSDTDFGRPGGTGAERHRQRQQTGV